MLPVPSGVALLGVEGGHSINGDLYGRGLWVPPCDWSGSWDAGRKRHQTLFHDELIPLLQKSFSVNVRI